VAEEQCFELVLWINWYWIAEVLLYFDLRERGWKIKVSWVYMSVQFEVSDNICVISLLMNIGTLSAKSKSVHTCQPGQQEGSSWVTRKALGTKPRAYDTWGKEGCQDGEETENPYRRIPGPLLCSYCNVLGFYSRWNFIALQKSIHYS
jgi:hypothetical protein